MSHRPSVHLLGGDSKVIHTMSQALLAAFFLALTALPVFAQDRIPATVTSVVEATRSRCNSTAARSSPCG